MREDVELAAALWVPEMRWLRRMLRVRTSHRGPAPALKMVTSILLRMAMAKGRPEVLATKEALDAGSPIKNWAHDYPGDSREKTQTYDLIKTVVDGNSPEAAIHANIELIRQMAELRDESGKLKHPDLCRVGMVDGTEVQAETEQRSTNKDPELNGILRRTDQQMVRTVIYRDDDGHAWRKWTGYKLVILGDMASTLPICWTLIPASGDERVAARQLIAYLFEVWPECPMEVLCGDSLYDKSKSFSHELVFNWGLQPVFSMHGEYAEGLAHLTTQGVPVCERCSELMKLKDDDGKIWTARKRAAAGIPRGQEAPDLNGRLRWKCANGCPGMAYTRPFDDPRLYTYYPRAGSHSRAVERIVLMWRRNAIESINASLKKLGVADRGVDRAGWASDAGMIWLLSLSLLGLTAKRFAHETGIYDIAANEAEQLGLLSPVTKANPGTGPDEFTLARVRQARRDFVDEPRAPRSWREELVAAWAA